MRAVRANSTHCVGIGNVRSHCESSLYADGSVWVNVQNGTPLCTASYHRCVKRPEIINVNKRVYCEKLTNVSKRR